MLDHSKNIKNSVYTTKNSVVLLQLQLCRKFYIYIYKTWRRCFFSSLFYGVSIQFKLKTDFINYFCPNAARNLRIGKCTLVGVEIGELPNMQNFSFGVDTGCLPAWVANKRFTINMRNNPILNGLSKYDDTGKLKECDTLDGKLYNSTIGMLFEKRTKDNKFNSK